MLYSSCMKQKSCGNNRNVEFKRACWDPSQLLNFFISNVDLFLHCRWLVAEWAGAGAKVLVFLQRVVFVHLNVPLLP